MNVSIKILPVVHCFGNNNKIFKVMVVTKETRYSSKLYENEKFDKFKVCLISLFIFVFF